MFQAGFDKLKEQTNRQNRYPNYSDIQQRAAEQSEENRATGLNKKVGQAGAAAGRMMNPTQGGGSGGATYTVNAGNQPYVGQLNALYEQIVNRKPFQYDLNGDLLYQQMADQYTQMGAQASRNAMGQAAALTGGYGNSYAEQVGAQANQQYMTAMNQNIPDLYQQELNAYLAEGDRMMQQYELAAAHPGMVEAISPKTYTVQQQSAEEGNDTSAYMQMLQNMLSGANATSNPATNALANWYYQLMNAQK